MKGLLYKDLMILKNQGRVLLLLLAFYIAMPLLGGGSVAMVCVMAVLLSALLPITAMSMDEKCRWERLALSMPGARRDLVLSKYLLGLLFTAGSTFFSMLAAVLIVVRTGEMPVSDVLGLSAACVGAAVFFISVLLPIMFHFGVEKGRLLMMLFVFLPTTLILLWDRLGLTLPSPKTLRTVAYAAPFALAALLYASIRLSLAIYRNKEF